MSTIRPLATIAVLAALGVYLALEINKQGPVSLDSAWETAETPDDWLRRCSSIRSC